MKYICKYVFNGWHNFRKKTLSAVYGSGSKSNIAKLINKKQIVRLSCMYIMFMRYKKIKYITCL